jgi:hypothetical protein
LALPFAVFGVHRISDVGSAAGVSLIVAFIFIRIKKTKNITIQYNKEGDSSYGREYHGDNRFPSPTPNDNEVYQRELVAPYDMTHLQGYTDQRSSYTMQNHNLRVPPEAGRPSTPTTISSPNSFGASFGTHPPNLVNDTGRNIPDTNENIHSPPHLQDPTSPQLPNSR